MLQIRLFGKPQVICDGTDITPELGNKGCALLCILFLRGGDYYAREKLAAYLWPDSAASAAKYNLRYTLWKIKKSTDIGEGGNTLSTGEKQLLSFARALLADPRIFVLDEATSSVDTVTERLIQDAIEKVMAGRTSFIIAHRLSTIHNADLIVVVDHGRIAEQGTHNELMERNGIYAKLIEMQSFD